MLSLLLFFGLFNASWGAAVSYQNLGLQPLLPDGRIVGGEETTIESFPHQVSLRYFSWHRCGGSIIKADAIITAAHCVVGIPLINMAFVAGTSDVTVGGETRKLKKSIVHPDYNDWTIDSDVAVVQLQNGYVFTEQIQPIELPFMHEEIRAETKVVVSGWGTVEEKGPEADILRYVAVDVIDREKCAAAYSEIREITPNMLCAGSIGGGKDACQGDSGGPLIDGRKLYGIVSWGKGCAQSEYPGVYAKVSSFRDWIDVQMGSFD